MNKVQKKSLTTVRNNQRELIWRFWQSPCSGPQWGQPMDWQQSHGKQVNATVEWTLPCAADGLVLTCVHLKECWEQTFGHQHRIMGHLRGCCDYSLFWMYWEQMESEGTALLRGMFCSETRGAAFGIHDDSTCTMMQVMDTVPPPYCKNGVKNNDSKVRPLSVSRTSCSNKCDPSHISLDLSHIWRTAYSVYVSSYSLSVTWGEGGGLITCPRGHSALHCKETLKSNSDS